jgi:CheY-like chemotaxis protein
MGKKILLADDSITIQKVIELTFSDEDFDVVTVGNGRLALERLAEVRPDIVLCDIIMPEKDGYEVCEQIKSSPTWSHVPVLLLTGAFEPFDQERATRAGYDGSLAKPFEPETLIAKVKELLARAPRPAPSPASAPRPVSETTVPPVTPSPFASMPAPAPQNVVPFARPADLPAPEAPAASAFIPDEPFSGLEDTAFAPEPETPVAPPVPVPSAPAPLAEISEEESADLSTPVLPEEPRAEDGASTVMFRASELPWAPEPPAAAEPEPVASSAAPAANGPVFVPDAAPAGEPELPEEPTVFEAVLEEDLEFGAPEYAPEPEPLAEPQPEALEEAVEQPEAPQELGDESIFAPELTVRSPYPHMESGASGAFAALVQGQVALPDGAADTAAFSQPLVPADDFEPVADAGSEPPAEEPVPPPRSWEAEDLNLPEPEPVPQAPGPAVQAAPPPVPETVAASTPPPLEKLAIEWAPAAAIDRPEPQPWQAPVEPEPVPSPADTVRSPQVARVPAAAVEETFADVAEAVAEPGLPPSEAATMGVPVDTVERIAQRVVAQISEKAVREIAWEVIPDLAEALIKQEIEKLKAELSKL